MTDGFSFQTGEKRPLTVLDYVFFSLVFALSSSVGFYHAYRWRHRTTENEFNFAGRSQHPLPVSISLAATFFSAITILGVPAEVYTNNTMILWSIVAGLISTLFVAQVFAPFFLCLNVTSCYEYIEKRFCRLLRVIASTMFMLQYLLYTGIVLYLPCLALQAVTDVSIWYTMVVVSVVCICYTVLGGMRSVILVDTFQFLIIVAGLVAALTGGIHATGGFLNAWNIAQKQNRIQFGEFSADPRTRHSVWALTFGYASFLMYINGLTQLQIQRICTLSTPRKAKIAVWLALPFYTVIQLLVCLAGLVMFAFYSKCHPVSFGLINKNDQLLPLFVLDVLGRVPGLSGLFIASVFSGSLSTLSSCLNTISTAILEDFIKPFCCRNVASRHGVYMSRALILVVGFAMFSIAVAASEMDQLILQFATSIHSMLIGPLMGIFVVGMFIPWTNSKGAAAGLFVSFAFMVWLVVGSILEKPTGRGPLPTSTVGCNWNASMTLSPGGPSLENANDVTHTFVNTTAHTLSYTMDLLVNTTTFPPHTIAVKHTIYAEPALHNFYRISYMWYSGLGTLINIFVSIVVSLATGRTDPSTIDSRLICPLFDRLFPWLPEAIRRPLRFGVVYNTDNADGVKTIYTDVGADSELDTGLLETKQ